MPLIKIKTYLIFRIIKKRTHLRINITEVAHVEGKDVSDNYHLRLFLQHQLPLPSAPSSGSDANPHHSDIWHTIIVVTVVIFFVVIGWRRRIEGAKGVRISKGRGRECDDSLSGGGCNHCTADILRQLVFNIYFSSPFLSCLLACPPVCIPWPRPCLQGEGRQQQPHITTGIGKGRDGQEGGDPTVLHWLFGSAGPAVSCGLVIFSMGGWTGERVNG